MLALISNNSNSLGGEGGGWCVITAFFLSDLLASCENLMFSRFNGVRVGDGVRGREGKELINFDELRTKTGRLSSVA